MVPTSKMKHKYYAKKVDISINASFIAFFTRCLYSYPPRHCLLSYSLPPTLLPLLLATFIPTLYPHCLSLSLLPALPSISSPGPTRSLHSNPPTPLTFTHYPHPYSLSVIFKWFDYKHLHRIAFSFHHRGTSMVKMTVDRTGNKERFIVIIPLNIP